MRFRDPEVCYASLCGYNAITVSDLIRRNKEARENGNEKKKGVLEADYSWLLSSFSD